MFAGEYLCKVDEKGRFIVPSPIREQVESEGQAVVFLKGPEESTLIYSMKEWEKVLERTKATLDELGLGDVAHDLEARNLLG